jgi:aspartate 1-decarboxylase
MRWMLRSKIHKATVTDADLRYEGSITIDEDLIEAVGLLAGEKVLVASNTSGNRLETYVITGARGSGTICMNGAAAHLIKKGEEIIIMGFELSDVPIIPKMILLGPENKVLRRLEKEFPGNKS